MVTMKQDLQHLDSQDPSVVPSDLTFALLNKPASLVPMVSARAYLGACEIEDGLRLGVDIIICGRVADASPVIPAAWYWYDWADHGRLASALIAGHLIECSAYVTGVNHAELDEHPLDNFIKCGFPIAEIDAEGSRVITKHPETLGMVNADIVRCRSLYELGGSPYLIATLVRTLET